MLSNRDELEKRLFKIDADIAAGKQWSAAPVTSAGYLMWTR